MSTNKSPTEGEEQQSRRTFIQNIFIFGGLTISMLFFIRNFLVYLFPSFKKKKTHKFMVAKKNELAIGEAKKIMLGNKPIFVVNLDDGHKVLSGICPHLGCIIRWEEQKNRFYCPCHQGVFDKTGKVTAGPPPRPLDSFDVKMENNLVFITIPEKLKGPWS